METRKPMNADPKLYSGKTKDIFRKPNGNLWIVFKDDVTGEDGVVDPGANTVMGQIRGKGRMSLELTCHFFELLNRENIPTHLVAVDLDRHAMEVREADPPGKAICAAGGLEFICRRKAYGSFVKRYRKYVREPLQDLDFLVEITLKDDERGDPLINDDAVAALGLLTRGQLDEAKRLTRRIAGLIEADLRGRDLGLVDLKVEFGLRDGKILLMDEISADSMRVMGPDGEILGHRELHRRLLGT